MGFMHHENYNHTLYIMKGVPLGLCTPSLCGLQLCILGTHHTFSALCTQRTLSTLPNQMHLGCIKARLATHPHLTAGMPSLLPQMFILSKTACRLTFPVIILSEAPSQVGLLIHNQHEEQMM